MSLGKAASYGATGATIGTAIAPGIGTAIGGGIGLLAGLFSDDENDGSQAAIEAAIAAINAVQIPEVDKAILINAYTQNGRLTPELIQQLPLHADTKQSIVEAPKNKENQDFTMRALKQLSQSGMSAQDLAQMQQMRSSVAEDTNAKTNQLLQQAQQRGTLDSGDQMAAQLMANQQGAQRASSGALDAAAAAAAARRDALQGFGKMATDVRGQDYNTQSKNMENELSRQRFLDTNSLGRQQANVGMQNTANAMNLERQQQTGDRNTTAQNDELKRQVEAKKWMAQMELDKARGIANARTGQAQMMQQAGQNAAQSESNLLGGLTSMAGTMSNAGMFDGLRPNTVVKAPAPGSSSSTSQFGGLGGNYKFAHGGEVPGPELVEGDSEENDIVPILASGGELMIPKSKAKDAKSAKSFIDKHFGQEDNKHEAILDLLLELHKKKSKE